MESKTKKKNLTMYGEELSQLLDELRSLALSGLARMYRPELKVFAFRLRRSGNDDVLEGVSRRYTAMSLLGLSSEDSDDAKAALRGHAPEDVCRQLLSEIDRTINLGDVAVTLWAARAWNIPAKNAIQQLKQLNPLSPRHPTVELAWALTALCADADGMIEEDLAKEIAALLLTSYHRRSRVFAHSVGGDLSPFSRGHVACFADLVYPTIALSHYGKMTGDKAILGVAEGCADFISETQGSAGQWWWHFDVRSGKVIEQYPVYAVHQDAMAPMALFAVADACRVNYDASVALGLQWLEHPPEIDGSLIDRSAAVIWRKVCRREPGKLSRVVQAAASAAHPNLRVPGLNMIFRPVSIDFESRPYHMGWVLYAWTKERVSKFIAGTRGTRSDEAPARMAHVPPV